MDYELVGEADAVNLIEKQSVRRVDLERFTLHQLRDGRLLVDFLSGNCAVLHGRDHPQVPLQELRSRRNRRPCRITPEPQPGFLTQPGG
jgi:hypothetical protein